MVHFKPLFVALAAVSTVVARPPCRSDTTAPTLKTTTSAPAPVCGITGYFVPDHDLTYLYSPGNKLSVEECLEGCAAYSGYEVIAFYYTGSNFGR
ncbi:Hypothetical protein NCS54_00458500 [Fusarium falciforme]|uniref:Hypothetical protein n=1 Tax=Fusarium falciforme TaxID=195108 RepID=UPI002301083F|nr:Hypothetical protein NCS54_00458500 [Fusarium falciforme]WAO87280.1 Hypothetical protein NCS54_00458500 [Fusarium falciforme]